MPNRGAQLAEQRLAWEPFSSRSGASDVSHMCG
uniref:Uncharacterized protein n=1 Tax=Arundo donax TaxID=35708 RepID=A0A0A9A221_ARUDO